MCILIICIYIYMYHGQYLIYSFKSSNCEHCILVFQVLGNHARIPCCLPLYSDGFPARDEIFHDQIRPHSAAYPAVFTNGLL